MLRFLCAWGLACALLAPGIDAAGQTRRRTTSRSTRRGSSSTASRAGNNAAALNDARARVAGQIKLLTRFLYLFGRVSSGVEATEAQARRGGRELPAQAAATLERDRNALRDNLRNVRDGLDQLELYFRTTPGLERYSTSVQGISGGAARAEDQAAANQLDAAGRTLIDVVSRLADALEGLN